MEKKSERNKSDYARLGHEKIYMQGDEIIEAGINLLLAVRMCPENRPYRKEIDFEIKEMRARLKGVNHAG